MKKSHLAAIGGGALLLAFLVGGNLYKSHKAEQIRAITQAPADPPPAAPTEAKAAAPATKAAAPDTKAAAPDTKAAAPPTKAAAPARSAPPRLSPVLVRDHSISTGPADARVILVEYFDPGCEACRFFSGFVKNLMAAHPARLRLVLRYAPFHKGADMMAAILEAARLQKRYWETLQVMYDTQPQWASHHHPQPERIWALLPAAGVDVERIRKDIQRPEVLAIVRQDIADAQTLGVRRTPAFFVNGKPLTDFGPNQLKALIDGEIAAQYGP